MGVHQKVKWLVLGPVTFLYPLIISCSSEDAKMWLAQTQENSMAMSWLCLGYVLAMSWLGCERPQSELGGPFPLLYA